jgi:hypothetical protein
MKGKVLLEIETINATFGNLASNANPRLKFTVEVPSGKYLGVAYG